MPGCALERVVAVPMLLLPPVGVSVAPKLLNVLTEVSVASALCSELNTELSELRPPRVLLTRFVWLVICCCGAAWRALTSAVTMALTSSPEPIPAELMVPPAVLVEPDELLDELLLEPLLVLLVSEFSNDERLLVPEVELVVMTLPFQCPEGSPPCGGRCRAPGKALVSQELCRWLP